MNSTAYVPYYQCTYATCSVQTDGQLHYIPTLGGNALYLALFALGLLAQVGLGIKYRTWGYMGSMIGGTALEIVGYAGRLMLNADDFNNNNFIIYLVGLTIGPALFSASIYLCLARIIAIYGDKLISIKPRTITVLFICCDLTSLVLQAAGGAMASLATTSSQSQTGINIMIAGLSTQVAATTAFCVICGWLMWSIRQHPEKVSRDNIDFRRRRSFRLFLIAIGIATLTILIRCSFRVAELSGGFNGSLANNEVSFMILDGAMMIICVTLLTVAHPGLILGPMWKAGGFSLRARKNKISSSKKESQISSGGSSVNGADKVARHEDRIVSHV